MCSLGPRLHALCPAYTEAEYESAPICKHCVLLLYAYARKCALATACLSRLQHVSAGLVRECNVGVSAR